MSAELNDIIASVKAYIGYERSFGLEEFLVDDTLTKAPAGNRGSLLLDEVKSQVLGCTNCDLHKTRLNVVFGSGDPRARLMFVGEAPGRDEDIQALPFVGRAGQLLTKIIEAMGMKREDVYIANILKCRPPDNRAPLPAEILACADNVRRQIEAISPKIICTLGKFASQTLLKTETPISSLRGKFYEYNGIKVMPTYHPAYLLRNPHDKKLVWEDMKLIMKELKKG